MDAGLPVAPLARLPWNSGVSNDQNPDNAPPATFQPIQAPPQPAETITTPSYNYAPPPTSNVASVGFQPPPAVPANSSFQPPPAVPASSSFQPPPVVPASSSFQPPPAVPASSSFQSPPSAAPASFPPPSVLPDDNDFNPPVHPVAGGFQQPQPPAMLPPSTTSAPTGAFPTAPPAPPSSLLNPTNFQPGSGTIHAPNSFPSAFPQSPAQPPSTFGNYQQQSPYLQYPTAPGVSPAVQQPFPQPDLPPYQMGFAPDQQQPGLPPMMEPGQSYMDKRTPNGWNDPNMNILAKAHARAGSKASTPTVEAPELNIVLKATDTLTNLSSQCSQIANYATKKKLDDVDKKLALLKEGLEVNKFSPNFACSLVKVSDCVEKRDLSSAMTAYNSMASQCSFGEVSQFMLPIKLLIVTAQQLQVFNQSPQQ